MLPKEEKGTSRAAGEQCQSGHLAQFGLRSHLTAMGQGLSLIGTLLLLLLLFLIIGSFH